MRTLEITSFFLAAELDLAIEPVAINATAASSSMLGKRKAQDEDEDEDEDEDGDATPTKSSHKFWYEPDVILVKPKAEGKALRQIADFWRDNPHSTIKTSSSCLKLLQDKLLRD